MLTVFKQGSLPYAGNGNGEKRPGCYYGHVLMQTYHLVPFHGFGMARLDCFGKAMGLATARSQSERDSKSE